MKTQFNVLDTVLMPEPNESDAWTYGGFYAVVTAIRENGNLIVEDQDSDFFEIEPERAIKIQEETTIESDAWTYGGFYAVVTAIRENGNLIVEDQDSNSWEIEPERAIKIQEDTTIPSIVVTRKMTYNPAPYLDYCEENQLTPTKDGFEEFIETWISADFQNENYEEEFSYVVS